MKLLKNPYFNAAVITAVSLFYAAVFIFTSGHMEFTRLLEHGATLSSNFWNGWSDFLRQGALKWVGYGYIVISGCILALSVIRKKSYDEYQAGILTRSFIVAGLGMLLLYPALLLLLLSDPNYAVETVLFLVVVHWSLFLVADLTYSIRWSR